MFLFKKIVSQFLFPMPLCLICCFTGLGLFWWTKRQKVGKILVTFGLLLLTALSYGPVADALLVPLEQKYPVYERANYRTTEPSQNRRTEEPVKYVVVLGGGHNSDKNLPISSQISNETLKRLIEGIRVYRQNPGSKLLLSGGTWLDPVPDAKIMADAAELLGVPDSEIITESESKDTSDEARLIKAIVATNRFVLVTSASHMPRSMALFEKRGMTPIPGPTEHLVQESPLSPSSFFPSSGVLDRSTRAFYEYLGIAWSAIRKDI